MFYSGWTLPAPTSMNVSALTADMRQSGAASNAANPYVKELPLPEAAEGPTAGAEAGAEPAVETQPSSPLPQPPASLPPTQSGGTGCVLQLAPRAALTYKEMEQQLQRRGSGSSDGFHIKSNLPLQAQTGVVLMECVVTRPPVSPLHTVVGTEEKGKQASPNSAAAAAKHPLPALVIGVCPRQLPWFSLPGEVNHSVGFYVAQRLIVKHGSDDRDEVVVPLEATNPNVGSSSGGGGGRVGEGDVVGCLVDLMRHTLAFTVNRHVVSTQRLDPAVEDGSLYFAVGLARRPQHTTNVAVRFYCGAACLREAAGAGDRARLHVSGQPACFPLTSYVRSLAMELVRHRSARGESDVESGLPSSADAELKAAGTNGVSCASPSTAAHAREAVRDLRVAAVLRAYLASRGMACTLTALDKELDRLAPSQTRLYAAAPSDKTESESGSVGAMGRRETSPSSLPAAATERTKRRAGSQQAPARLSPPQETRAAWHSFAANMAELRRTILNPPEAAATPAPAVSPLSSLLLTRVLWSPSVIASLAGVVRGGEGGEDYLGRSGITAAAQRRGSSASPYSWFHDSVSPAFLTLCLLTLRQDMRYLLHAHYAVEELWRRLRGHVSRVMKGSTATTDGKAHAAPLPLDSEADDAQRSEVASFTAFFTELMWDGSRVLPSALTRDHAHQQQRHHQRRGSSSDPSALLRTPALHVLASLAGHSGEASREGGAAHTTSVPRGGGRGAAVYTEAQRFLACVAGCEASAACTTATTMASTAKSAPATENTQTSKTQGRAAHRALSPPATSSSLEEGLRLLYACAVVPASAPRRSAQSRLLQTLCSLLSHTLGILRELEASARSDSREEKAAIGGVRVHGSVRDSLDLLGRLLDTVLQGVRQAVWRRLAHAVEEANAQLADRLTLWKCALAGAAPHTAAHTACEAAEESHGSDESCDAAWDEEAGEEENEGTRERAPTGSLTASLSSFQAPEMTDEEREGDDDESSAAQPLHTWHRSTSATPAASYESVTEALPSLRRLWRRVAARAALAPSRHLVTHLFVQELRDALAAAPRASWRAQQAPRNTSAARGETAMEATATTDDAVPHAHAVDAVSGKRRSSSARTQRGEDGDAAAAAAATVKCNGDADAAAAVEERWFTEELYLCSVYMKRVVKHLDGQ